MKFEYGFKTASETIASDIWAELNRDSLIRLEPAEIAEFLEIEILPVSALNHRASGEVSYFHGRRQSKLSAFTMFLGWQRTIFVNDVHHPNRQRSSIAHELAHALLGHPPTPPLTADGVRNFDRPLEKEAEFLGAALLIPRSSAIESMKAGLSSAEIADLFGVSKQLAAWRIGDSGARTIMSRTRAKYG